MAVPSCGRDLPLGSELRPFQKSGKPYRSASSSLTKPAQTADFRPKSERLRAKISEVVTETVGVQALKFEADGSAASQFTRAVGLYWLFVRPNSNGAANEVANRAAYTRVLQDMRFIRASLSFRTTLILRIDSGPRNCWSSTVSGAP